MLLVVFDFQPKCRHGIQTDMYSCINTHKNCDWLVIHTCIHIYLSAVLFCDYFVDKSNYAIEQRWLLSGSRNPVLKISGFRKIKVYTYAGLQFKFNYSVLLRFFFIIGQQLRTSGPLENLNAKWLCRNFLEFLNRFKNLS